MPTIAYPQVPNYPGVPSIPRTAPGTPAIVIRIAPPATNTSQSSNEPIWGIYTVGSQTVTGQNIYTPTEGGTLSVLSFGFTRAMQVSDFKVEAPNPNQGAAFASFNKVYQPAQPVITLSLDGTDGEKTDFLAAIDMACGSTAVYNVITPDTPAGGNTYTLERYSYQRSATHGADLLIVEVSLTQIEQVTAALSNASITSPQSPSASAQVSNGNTQPSTPPTSWLAHGAQALGVP